ncbi:hypothetical protein TNCV_488721 [Trichonephila clavipes]|nr:hypothetical protein TNCV_488721 [Trichonephila clavipes]
MSNGDFTPHVKVKDCILIQTFQILRFLYCDIVDGCEFPSFRFTIGFMVSPAVQGQVRRHRLSLHFYDPPAVE